MFNTLYITTNKSENWFQLRNKESHVCLACDQTLEGIHASIKNLVVKYKTESRLLHMISKMSEGTKISPADFSLYTTLVKEGREVHKNLVRDAVEKGAEEVKLSNPVLRNKKRFKSVEVKEERGAEQNITPSKVFKRPLKRFKSISL